MGDQDQTGTTQKRDGNPHKTLFLCWSGNRSKRVAEQLRTYFCSIFSDVFKTEDPNCLPRVVMSETAIKKGTPWSEQLLADLKNAAAGIVCLTPENRGSGWLHFEGGSLASQRGQDNETASSTLFSFLFTMDTAAQQGPLSLFQATVYKRDYDRDRDELNRLTQSVLKRFEGCEKHEDFEHRLCVLLNRLRELEFLAFREVLPNLERHARKVLHTIDDLDSARSRTDALSALFGLQTVLEDAQRLVEVICAPSQLMFFERLREGVSAARDALEDLIADGVEPRLKQTLHQLKRMLDAAVEPLPPVLDDSWRYSLYGEQDPLPAYRKRKLLLVHPLENRLQRAELQEKHQRGDDKVQAATLPAAPLPNESDKRRALRSFWAFDRIAAYIHYCEDATPPDNKKALDETLMELTRAVLKEMSLLEVGEAQHESPESDDDTIDDLPLRFALRALVLKIKLGIGHGRYSLEDNDPVSDRSSARAVIEDRIKLETGMSFAGVDDMLASLRGVGTRTAQPNEFGLKPPLASLCDDLERLLPPAANTKSAPT